MNKFSKRFCAFILVIVTLFSSANIVYAKDDVLTGESIPTSVFDANCPFGLCHLPFATCIFNNHVI